MVIIIEKKIWPFVLSGFFLVILLGCDAKKEEPYNINWEDRKAVNIEFSPDLIDDKGILELEIHLKGQDQKMLGDWSSKNAGLTFTPIVPFSPGKSYILISGDKEIITFTIDSFQNPLPEILAVYPTSDTLPSNLLKMYVKFSTPMTTGRSIDYINVLDKSSEDTLDGTFLDLQPELWNEDNTLLTLWLDPGRIKRGLIPNMELGAPLESNQDYRIIISEDWEDVNGNPLEKVIIKEFKTGPRDEKHVDPGNWDIDLVQIDTKDPLKIKFGEPLDAILLRESFTFYDSNNILLEGEILLKRNEQELHFIPANNWVGGEHSFRVESRLEDLAGNNLNRLFDQKISDSVTNEIKYIEMRFYLN